MVKKEEIELSPIEATAYWWINLMRYRVREIATSGARDRNEAKFAEIFYSFTEIDWRKVYLELIKYIYKDVESYIPKNHSDAFSQDTDIEGHNILNDEMFKIIGQQIPDIRLASNGVKDSVIYTTVSVVSVWNKSCGVNKLATKYEPSYVLTGDRNSLDFYNLLISTIAVLNKIASSFKSVSTLRERFCREYIKLSELEETFDDVVERFNYAFNKASDNEIILGRSCKEMYFPSFRDIDYIGLDSYIDLANHYANVILQKTKDGDKTPFCKILKKN